jgi:uncharacterized membrane protein YeaQ/YmgE (transglycosylase-associated protein family)
MHIIWFLFVGLFVGAVAKMIMPGKDPGGAVITMLLGVGGAVLAGMLGEAFGIYRAGDTGWGIIASVIGAVFLLATHRMVAGRRTA